MAGRQGERGERRGEGRGPNLNVWDAGPGRNSGRRSGEGPGPNPGGRRARGSVTAEFAVLLPVVALMVAAVLAAGSAGVAKLRCVDAARSAARLAARHEPRAVAVAAARAAGPSGAVVDVSAAGELVRVEVRAQVRLPLPGRPSVAVDGFAVARLEEAPAGAEVGLALTATR